MAHEKSPKPPSPPSSGLKMPQQSGCSKMSIAFIAPAPAPAPAPTAIAEPRSTFPSRPLSLLSHPIQQIPPPPPPSLPSMLTSYGSPDEPWSRPTSPSTGSNKSGSSSHPLKQSRSRVSVNSYEEQDPDPNKDENRSKNEYRKGNENDATKRASRPTTNKHRPPRPCYTEEQKFFIMYSRIVRAQTWPLIEERFVRRFGDGSLRSKGGLTSVYYRIRKEWGLEDVLRSAASDTKQYDQEVVFRKAECFSTDVLREIGYFERMHG